MLQLLQSKFGFHAFKPGQQEVIEHVMAGKDTIAILPTGMGKSLCYQLPGYMLDGAVLVISPLVALMEDQVAIMKKNGEKRVVALNSFQSPIERRRSLQNLRHYKFIFVSPEMLNHEQIRQQLSRLPLSLLVIDEAHCISQWGFDFRPDYLRIGEFIHTISRPRILALTATANEKVIADIEEYVHMKDPTVYVHSLDRPNIIYNCVHLQRNDKDNWICDRLVSTSGPGIVYVSSRKRAEELAHFIQEKGIATAAYHAGMEREDRAFIQEQFLSGQLNWIFATSAFGMGIHKDDVRQVIHEQLPATIANYMQEVGRGGRDGQPSVATLLYSPDDEERTRYIIQEDLPQKEEVFHAVRLLEEGRSWDDVAELIGLRETQVRVLRFYLEQRPVEETIHVLKQLRNEKNQELEKMIQFVHADCCLRGLLLAYFGQKLEGSSEQCCSICGFDDGWLYQKENTQEMAYTLNWEERITKLLG